MGCSLPPLYQVTKAHDVKKVSRNTVESEHQKIGESTWNQQVLNFAFKNLAKLNVSARLRMQRWI